MKKKYFLFENFETGLLFGRWYVLKLGENTCRRDQQGQEKNRRDM
jgi:hypothetical protein